MCHLLSNTLDMRIDDSDISVSTEQQFLNHSWKYGRFSSRLYLYIEIKGHSRASSCIFKDHFSTEIYSMDSIRAHFNVFFSDDGTVLLNKKI